MDLYGRSLVLAITISLVSGAALASTIVPAIVPDEQAHPIGQIIKPADRASFASAMTPEATQQGATPPAAIINPPASSYNAVTTRLGNPNEFAPTPESDDMTSLLKEAPPSLPILSPDVPLTGRETQSASIASHWRSRRVSPGEGENGTVVFPYGATIPNLVCAPLQICSISLQAGEVVNDIKAGDAARWLITPSIVGNGPDRYTVISVKPTDAGLRTNLVIATTRRLYSIQLVSNSSRWVPNISFTYPEDTGTAWKRYQEAAQRQSYDNTLPSGQNIAALDFNFSLSSDRPAWRPLRVYSDGIKTYIQFPRAMLSGDAPALVALANDATWFSSPTHQIVNYRVQGDTYVVDKVLSRAALISGVGGAQEQVQIMHTGGR
jgi:type IV secretion system protein VirB9